MSVKIPVAAISLWNIVTFECQVAMAVARSEWLAKAAGLQKLVPIENMHRTLTLVGRSRSTMLVLSLQNRFAENLGAVEGFLYYKIRYPELQIKCPSVAFAAKASPRSLSGHPL